MADAATVRGAVISKQQHLQHGLAPGSLRYFACLFSGSADRALVEAIYAFEAELQYVVSRTAHEAAHARLQWWRGELDRLAAGRPTHPLALALLPLRDRRNIDLTLLHEMLVAADLDLARMTYASWQELDAYLFRSAGSAQTLIATLLAAERHASPAEREFARRLGAAARQIEMLSALRHDLASGRLYLPLQVLEAAAIEPASFAQDPGTPTGQALVAEWRRRVQAELAALAPVLGDPAERRAQRHGLVLAALHEQWLARLPGHTTPAGGPARLAPLSRLWTAWRTALRHG
jgi:phytoene synthase